MNRKTAHGYPNEFSGSSGQVRGAAIVVEATWLGSFEPYTTKALGAYLADMMIEQGQSQLVERHGLRAFEAKVLRPERTLCEKIMSLVRFSYGEDALQDLRLKIRHTYDLHKMLENEAVSRFFQSTDFDSLILAVARNDVVSYKSSNAWLARPPQDALIFLKTDALWNDLEATYRKDFSRLVFGELPSSEKIRMTLKAISRRLSQIAWDIEIPD